MEITYVPVFHFLWYSMSKLIANNRDPGFYSPDPDRRNNPDPSGSETLVSFIVIISNCVLR